MRDDPGATESFDFSVVMPSYNSEIWLPDTLASIDAAVARSGCSAEIIVVDDGSTDRTGEVLESAARNMTTPLRVIVQENKGRFLARWAGLQVARSDRIVLVDSRVLVDKDSFRYLAASWDAVPDQCWNGHFTNDQSNPLVGYYWDLPLHIFWGSYLSRPKPTVVTAENFDRVPKGTGMFAAPRDPLMQAFRESWPVGDPKLTSDDTKILRALNESYPFMLDPGFSARYRSRTTVRAFIAHSFSRGTLFVDSYFGTSALRSLALIALVLAPLAWLALVIAAVLSGHTGWALVLLGCVFVCFSAVCLAGIARRCPSKSLAAFVLYTPVFVVPFWAGLVRGLVNRVGHAGAKLPHEGSSQ